jgi:antitoxin VapB
MPLSIRNPTAEKLARAVAATTGETLTDAIIHALEERLERVEGRRSPADLAQEILVVSRRCAALPDHDTRPVDEILGYDETGAPS